LMGQRLRHSSRQNATECNPQLILPIESARRSSVTETGVPQTQPDAIMWMRDVVTIARVHRCTIYRWIQISLSVGISNRLQGLVQPVQPLSHRLDYGTEISLRHQGGHLSYCNQLVLFAAKIWVIHVVTPMPLLRAEEYSPPQRDENDRLSVKVP